jgi:hypothetical protein
MYTYLPALSSHNMAEMLPNLALDTNQSINLFIKYNEVPISRRIYFLIYVFCVSVHLYRFPTRLDYMSNITGVL